MGGGSNPKFNPEKAIIWDDSQSKCVGELSFSTPVRNIKMNKESVVAVLDNRIYIYGLTDLKLKDAIDTYDNPQGLCCLSAKSSDNIVAFPDKDIGCIRIVTETSFKKIQAHEGNLACISLNYDGSLIATASTKGTLIRIFNTATGDKLHEFRRGSDTANIYSIAFSGNDMLAVTSDKGTVHVFNLGAEEEKKEESDSKNTKSVFGYFGNVLPSYFSSEWSFAQFKFAEAGAVPYTTGAFTTDNKLVLLSKKGDYYLLDIDVKEKVINKVAHRTINKE